MRNDTYYRSLSKSGQGGQYESPEYKAITERCRLRALSYSQPKPAPTPVPKVDTHKVHDDLHNMLEKLKADVYEIKSNMVHLATTLPAPKPAPTKPKPAPTKPKPAPTKPKPAPTKPKPIFKIGYVHPAPMSKNDYDTFHRHLRPILRVLKRTAKTITMTDTKDPYKRQRRYTIKTDDRGEYIKWGRYIIHADDYLPDGDKHKSPQPPPPPAPKPTPPPNTWTYTPLSPQRYRTLWQKNALDLLGIGGQTNATPEQVKKAYKKSCLKAHPDKGGSSERFQEVYEAYKLLSN